MLEDLISQRKAAVDEIRQAYEKVAAEITAKVPKHNPPCEDLCEE